MNYNLTDFSRTELKVLSDLIQEKIDETTNHLKGIQQYIPPGDVKEDMIRDQHRYKAVLKEINVRVLTSLQIVRDKDKEVAN